MRNILVRCITTSSLILVSDRLYVPNLSADTISIWNGGSGNWGNAGQWTPARVPNNSGSQSYGVTIGGGGDVTLDTSPTVDTLVLNGVLSEGFDPANGQRTTLTVQGNATINGGISSPSAFHGNLDNFVFNGNLVNNGGISSGAMFSVAGNLQNAGTFDEIGQGIGAGNVTNTGTLNFGSTDGVISGGRSNLASLVNKGGSLFVGSSTSVTVGSGYVDLNKNASLTIIGTTNVNLGNLQGTTLLAGSNTLGAQGETIINSGSFALNTMYGGPVAVTLVGNFSNSGTVVVGTDGTEYPDQGVSTLIVTRTFTNHAGGSLNVNNPMNGTLPSSFHVQALVNNGTADFQAGTASTAQTVTNRGTLNVFGDAAGDIGSLTTDTLKLEAGLVEVWNNGGTLIVGSGTAPSGFSGYYQTANGVLALAGGSLEVEGPVDLNGALDIMLGNGSKPIGSVFTVLTGAYRGVSGTFSTIEGSVFDGGLERYALTYGPDAVTLTVVSNTTPEPSSLALLLVGCVGLGAAVVTRKRSLARLP